LIDRFNIDIEQVIEFCKKEYERAEITPEMVDTGAVIVTGETAKKDNAAEIVRRLSSESGKFVSASAGPNFESMLGIMGSGTVEQSKRIQKNLMNVDVGGGTSNIAIASKGDVISTSCINVGGRLLGIDKDFKIWRIDEPTKWIMDELSMSYTIGDIIPEEDVLKITREYAKALFEAIKGPVTGKIAKLLMMTDDIEILVPIDGYSFSGGVAEMIYDSGIDEEMNENLNPYNDIGSYLAKEIKYLIEEYNLPLIEPENKIRATVIGAGAFSLSISGSTCYYDEAINLPLENVPIVPINIDSKELYNEGKFSEHKERIAVALKNFSLVEGEDVFALYFKDILIGSSIVPLAKIIELALPNSIEKNKMIIVILRGDGGKMLGLTLKKETSVKANLFCLDELELEAGDWIDIGAPFQTENRKAFPVTIKSLVFNQSKESN
jgi:ethanolamine utilization protein EutA